MFNAFAKVTTGVDKTGDIQKILQDLAQKQVYVGIPEGNDRATGEGGNITNAELLYILSHGVREKEMRDEMNPKVESGQMPYSKAFELFLHEHGSALWHTPPRPVLEPAINHSRAIIAKQLKKVAEAALNGLDPYHELEKAGMLGQNIARDWFTNPANGWAPNTETTALLKGSDQPMIDTGEMRRAIVYVIQNGK